MHFQIGSALPLETTLRLVEPGACVLPPIDAYRIVVHLSRATRTFCRETGSAALREIGDIDLIPSGDTGGFDAEAAYQSLEIRLSPVVLDRVGAEIGRITGANKLEGRHMLRHDRIFNLARSIEHDLSVKSASDLLYAESIGIALAIQLLGLRDEPLDPLARLSPIQLKRVLTYIDEKLDQPLTLEILSREAGVSNSHLRTWFKVAMGLTVHRYVLRRRVERARFLLLQGELGPSEVALEVGFAHQSHMARWMRRELGCSPGDLRRTAINR
ncbi:AraC family transcriptional regulator [Bradyrhizobium sp. Arg237L]|uniref:helix-turn-helix transcriptional regulator n=1 Tax=Bradyrhizobium sp. Arg237L TaxID=3003352 RepID=UPI00249F62BE|nr:AraC family transcriptional regulator [Bradyrhizobium sp. Arg237L]MDI4235489.1 AraC family transcriptional regulator [Bradyrhizobium sp. Arg237L]